MEDLHTLLVASVAFATLLPWGLRNQQAFGRFSLTSFNGGVNLWMGNNPESQGGYTEMPREIEVLPLPQRDDLLKQRAIAYIKEDPARYVGLCLKRVFVSLRSDTIGPAWNEVGIRKTFGERGTVFFKVVCSLAHWAILLSVFVALWRLGRRSARAPEGALRQGLGLVDLELGFALLLLSVPFVLIVGGNRYMLPIMPILCVWLGAGMGPRLSLATSPSVPAATTRHRAAKEEQASDSL